MKTFVKLSNSKSTKYRSLDLHCLLTSLGKQQWKCWTDYQGRERKSLCRKNQAGSCLQRENLRTQGWKGFVDLHKILPHSWVPRSSAWSLGISEPTKPVRAAFASFSDFLLLWAVLRAAALLCSSNGQLYNSCCTASSSPALTIQFHQRERAKDVNTASFPTLSPSYSTSTLLTPWAQQLLLSRAYSHAANL